MAGTSIYQDIAKRTGGDIYIGVVGPVRTGKSTFIKKFMEELVLPNIEDADARARARDELPQSASGKTVMTAEPKFIPESAAQLRTADGMKMRVKLVDCVGYLVDGALGAEEDGSPRMVNTPWAAEKMEFSAAARLGTEKVMREHSTVGIVVTTDGSIGEIPRENYASAEAEIIAEMKKSEKPFIILVNCQNPHSEEAQMLGRALEEKYGVAVALVNCMQLSGEDIEGILSILLLEFPIRQINVDLPAWICALESGHPFRESVYRSVRDAAVSLEKIGEIRRAFEMGISEDSGAYFESMETDLGNGAATVRLSVPSEKYFEVLSELTGMQIANDAELFEAFYTLSQTKAQYDKVAGALADVERKGYGIVMPSVEELVLKEPQIVKQAGGYGVRLRAAAKSIHMIKADIEAEINPIVGSESQSEELVKYIKSSVGSEPEKIWDTNMLGKSLYELVNEGLHTKLQNIPEDAQKRLSETLERVINEGSGGLICIIL